MGPTSAHSRRVLKSCYLFGLPSEFQCIICCRRICWSCENELWRRRLTRSWPGSSSRRNASGTREPTTSSPCSTNASAACCCGCSRNRSDLLLIWRSMHYNNLLGYVGKSPEMQNKTNLWSVYHFLCKVSVIETKLFVKYVELGLHISYFWPPWSRRHVRDFLQNKDYQWPVFLLIFEAFEKEFQIFPKKVSKISGYQKIYMIFGKPPVVVCISGGDKGGWKRRSGSRRRSVPSCGNKPRRSTAWSTTPNRYETHPALSHIGSNQGPSHRHKCESERLKGKGVYENSLGKGICIIRFFGIVPLV